MTAKKLIYLANLRLPTEKAYGIQIAKMCEVLGGLGIEATLIAPFRWSDIKEDFFDYYSVRKNFAFRILTSPDFDWPGELNKLSFNIKSFISALNLVGYAPKPDSSLI